MSVGFTGEHILNKLRIFSKLVVPPTVVEFVRRVAEACGTVQMALVGGKYVVGVDVGAAPFLAPRHKM